MKAKLGERGQIVIPKPYRDRLGLRVGQLMEIDEDRGRLIVTKAADHDSIESIYGILRDEFAAMGFDSTDHFIREIRGGDRDATDPGLRPE